MQLSNVIITIIIGIFSSASIAATAEKRATTDDDYKLLWSPEKLTACIWTHENNKKTRELGISDEMWKRMMLTCYAGVKEGEEIARENHYHDTVEVEISKLRYDNNEIARYKQVFPDWKARETRVIESVRKDCGTPCNNIKPETK